MGVALSADLRCLQDARVAKLDQDLLPVELVGVAIVVRFDTADKMGLPGYHFGKQVHERVLGDGNMAGRVGTKECQQRKDATIQSGGAFRASSFDCSAAQQSGRQCEAHWVWLLCLQPEGPQFKSQDWKFHPELDSSPPNALGTIRL